MARKLFGPHLFCRQPWPNDRAVVDCFGDRPIKEIIGLLTTVGFGSPPSWIKPYRVLSNGEQFRCDLARALAWGMDRPSQAEGESGPAEKPEGIGAGEPGSPSLFCSPPRCLGSSLVVGLPIVAFDEFTSVVDRNVARIVSAAIAKGIRSGRIGCRFVAITCHYDVSEWLAPDWVIDMASATFSWRCLRRPEIRLELFRCHRTAWRMFARHHYLTGALSPMARCFLALWEGVPVTFCATLPQVGRHHRWRVSRLVTLPDYQGVGIGMAVLEGVAQVHRAAGHRIGVTASHPALIAHCRRSPHWRTVRVRKTGSSGPVGLVPKYRGSLGRAVVSFEYVGPTD